MNTIRDVNSWASNDGIKSAPDEGGQKPKKAPGVPAKKTGKPLKRGAALQVMIYPRPGAKGAIVEASRRSEKSMSSFCILASLEAAARSLGCSISDLGVSEEELKNYR